MTVDPVLIEEHRHTRRTPPAARGEAATWLTGGALAICIVLIASVIAVIVYRGGRTFWPGPIDHITLDSGQTLLGVPLNTEPVDENNTEELRQRFRVGNRDLGQESFEWIDQAKILSATRPEHAWYVEREDWGVFLGFPEAIVHESNSGSTVAAGPEGDTETLAQGAARVRESFARLHAEAVERRGEIKRLNDVTAPRLQGQINRIEWARRKILLNNTEGKSGTAMGIMPWIGVGLLALTLGWLALVLIRKTVKISIVNPTRRVWHTASVSALALSVGLGAFAVLERPWASNQLDENQIQQAMTSFDDDRAHIEIELKETLDKIRELRVADSRTRIVIRDPRTGRIAPESRSEPDTPIRLSQVVRVVEANELSFLGRVGVYLARWGEFLTAEPRANGAEGGVFPVIVGTITLTLLLTVFVVPLGVMAAIYLREYARQGAFTSAIRIAINNLAGVPSIVYGMFGLGFFCYFLGGYIDEGPTAITPRPAWWLGVGLTLVLVVLGTTSALFATHRPGTPPSRVERFAKSMCWVLWTGAIASAGWLIFTTPYFSGFFAHKLPESSTFGGRGILWAALTLALLTLPVVIVATEEAISAVPNSMREGSLACGASKWQTIRRVVLPSSLPGVMTGAILAMARGAGEVAPLMLVGVVNFAPALPVSAEAPFLHGDRTFMHLGFHIYSLGFQSPDSAASEPLVWTTTLLLITIILLLNLVAVLIRTKLRNQTSSASI